MNVLNLDIQNSTKNLYKERLRRIKESGLFFQLKDGAKSYPGCDFYSFGRVLHIRKFKDYAIAIFFIESKKRTLIIKDNIRESFLKYVRKYDYLYVSGKEEKSGDIQLLSFKIVSISLYLETKNKDFLHQRLIGNLVNHSILKQYSEVYSKIDLILKEKGYIEIKSKILQDSFYGGLSRPFTTHSNNTHKEKYLRFSSEPVLKAILIGGIEKVYEFGTVFRNEPDSSIRGEEIRALEFCSTNESLKDFRKLLFKIIQTILGCKKIVESDYNKICKINDYLLSFEDFKTKIVPTIIEPTIVYNLPSGTSPFIASEEKIESVAKRELLIINGMTIAEIYQNERDPLKQIKFLEKQFVKDREYKVDYSSYIHSQLLGGPIINVSFMSIDRLLSLLTDQKDIRRML